MSRETNYKLTCLEMKKSNAKFKINDKVIILAENDLPKNITDFNKLIKKNNIKYLISPTMDSYNVNFLTKLNTKVI